MGEDTSSIESVAMDLPIPSHARTTGDPSNIDTAENGDQEILGYDEYLPNQFPYSLKFHNKLLRKELSKNNSQRD